MSKPIDPRHTVATSTVDEAGQVGEVSGFTHKIIVRWSDCDPAKIAYTGRIPNFALEAIDAWWEAHLGIDWYQLTVDRGLGLPFVHMSIDLRAPVTPRHPLLCDVHLLRMGESSFRFRVEARQNGVLCFEGEFVEVYATGEITEKLAIPDDMRAQLTPFLAS